MNLKIICWWIILALLPFLSYSQKGVDNVMEMSTHSPNVASLGKYGDYPVDMSTGVPNITIPLFTIKGRKLELPLSISYHSSGVKVDEEASNLGLGWSLFAGGMISRVVRDLKDESGSGFLFNYDKIPDLTSIQNLDGMMDPAQIGNSAELKRLFESVDKEPDLFTINSNLISGSFSLNNNGEYISLDLEPFKATVDLFENLITIVDKSGTIFRFGKSLNGVSAFETTSDRYDQGGAFSSKTYSSAWHLTEIISFDFSDTVRFYYKNGYNNNSRFVGTERYILDPNQMLSLSDKVGTVHEGVIHTYLQTIISNMQLIDKIEFSGGYIQFDYMDDRLDKHSQVAWGKARLVSMSLFNFKNALLKKIVLRNNEYFLRTASGSLPTSMPVEDEKKKSLKLVGIDIYGSAPAQGLSYSFVYDSTPLPPRNTMPQDLWGYYNGKGNGSLIPEVFLVNGPTPRFIGESREADFNFMKAGLLNKIIYPTGGFTQYEFEPNYYLNEEQQEGKTQKIREIRNYAISRAPECPVDYLGSNTTTTIQEFNISEDLGANQIVGRLSIYFSDYINFNGQPMTARLTGPGVSYFAEHIPSERSNRKSIDFDIIIKSGGLYRLELNTNGVSGSASALYNSPIIESSISYEYWEWSNINQIIPKQAGGLRVKRIINYTNEGTIGTTRSFSYGNLNYGPDQVGVGKLISDPSKTFFNYPALYRAELYQDVLINNIHFTSHSQIQLGFNNGSPVDYSIVTETINSPTDESLNGKIVRHFSGVSGIYEPSGSYKFPYNTIYYPTWKRSVLQRETTFKSMGPLQYVPVNMKEWIYSEAPESRTKILRMHEFQPDVWRIEYIDNGSQWILDKMWDNNPNRYMYYNFFISAGRKILTKEIEQSFSDGNQVLTVEKNYSYNTNWDVSQITSKSSKGESIVERTKYTFDLNYDIAATRNIISLPVHHERLINNKLIDGLINVYDENGLLSKIYTAKMNLENSADYTSIESIPQKYQLEIENLYTTAGKQLLQKDHISNPTSVYLWSYSNRNIIAEIINSDWETVSAVLGSANIENIASTEPSEIELNAFLAPLRSDLRMSGARVTTYFYEPIIGLKSIINWNGQSTQFKYDYLGRLSHIIDDNGNIIKKYCYNYISQGETTANWQPITAFVCEKDASGYNTGYQSRTVKDVEPCSSTYNSTKLDRVYNPSACPISYPCTTPCSGIDKKCINNICETGCKVYTSSVYTKINNPAGDPPQIWVWRCTFHYQWSDGTISPNYTEDNNNSCTIGNPCITEM